MRLECDFFDTDMQCVSRNIYFKLLKHKKCSHKKYFINNPNFFEV